MRILLIHNPKAGDRKHSKKQLLASLTRSGHQAFYQSIKKRGWKQAFEKPVDLVIAAGGDGTVHKSAWQLLDSGIPLAILPLGTANNLARSSVSPDLSRKSFNRFTAEKDGRSMLALRALPRGRNTFWRRREAGCSPTTFPSQRRTKKRMLLQRKNSRRT